MRRYPRQFWPRIPGNFGRGSPCREPKYDIRDWSPDGSKMGKGISLSHDEMAILKGILEDMEL